MPTRLRALGNEELRDFCAMQGPLSMRALAGVLAAAALPLMSLGAVLGTFVSILMERMALTGHVHALLAGTCVWYACIGHARTLVADVLLGAKAKGVSVSEV